MCVNGLIFKDLFNIGIEDIKEIIYNPNYETLFKEETKPELDYYSRGILTETGAIAVDTGIFTGRSPKDKYIVYDTTTKNTVWWNNINITNDNHQLSINNWNELKKCCTQQLSHKRLFVMDVFCGADESTRLKVRFIMEVAWQAHFVKNMFIRPSEFELNNFKPDFTVLNASKCTNPNWKEQGLHSENFIAFNFTENMQLIGGTWYSGEMKKGLFSIMNYILPRKGIASMHCAANVSNVGDNVALFFGLSGTGKTTLSTDRNRQLIGDDEHGWDDNGIFNFEGGCYAKVIKLIPKEEPEIYQAIRRNALLENVLVNQNGSVDYENDIKTENTRVSYPIYHINNITRPLSKAGHAKKVIFLTADAFGVLPPVSYLTPEQTEYYFLSGFTAKLAGTERGVINPIPTFSACFAAAFLTLHPIEYSKILLKRMKNANTTAYLINTGWNANGKRISLKNTRFIIQTILSGEIENAEKLILPIFNLEIPKKLSQIDEDILDPRKNWIHRNAWKKAAQNLAKSFILNFEQYLDTTEGKSLLHAGPQL